MIAMGCINRITLKVAARRLPGWLAMLGLAAACGCGDSRPERVQVSGRVLIDGRPLEVGTVRFISPKHRPAGAKLEKDGRFTLSTYELGDGVVMGQHAVTVMGMEQVDKRTRRWHAPKKYCAPATSELTANITEATDSLEFNLTWDGKKPFDERIGGGGD
jgi:hypothetical protein